MEDGSPIQASLYETDLTAWAEQQAAALRRRDAGRNALDYDNLAEEIDDVAGSLLRSCRSYIDVILLHLLKLQFTPSERDNAGWRRSIIAARVNLEGDLSPTLAARLPDQMPELFGKRLRLLRENDLGLDVPLIRRMMPEGYTWDEVRDENWWPEPHATVEELS